jgi:hypothetical protein
MDITLYCNEACQNVTISHFDDLSPLIELYFDIMPDNQVITLNGKMLTKHDKLNHNDLLVITSGEQLMPQSLIQIMGEHKYKFKMIIDSGASKCMMSEYLAKLLELPINTRNKGMAHGIGTAKIVGTADATIKIHNDYYHMNFDVTETDITDLTSKYLVLVGLDFLHRHQCEISLKRKTITVNDKVINLLSEYELNKYKHPTKIETSIEVDYRKLNLSVDEHLMLKKILNNIVSNPYDEKYKSINVNSQTFKKYLSNCTEFMKSLGFVQAQDFYKFNNNVNILQEVIEIM